MQLRTYRNFYLVPRYYRSDRGFTIKWLGFVCHHRNNNFK